MRAVAHSPEFAKQVGVPQSVGKEFSKAKGGSMKKPNIAAIRKGLAAAIRSRAPMGTPGGMDGMGGMGGMGAPPSAPMGGAPGMKKGGTMKKRYDDGGEARGGKMKAKKRYDDGGEARGGKMKAKKRYDDGGEARGGKMKKMAKGGSAFRSSADGIAQRGKTKAKQPTMAKGGRMKGCA
jgi:hypothetical protein